MSIFSFLNRGKLNKSMSALIIIFTLVLVLSVFSAAYYFIVNFIEDGYMKKYMMYAYRETENNLSDLTQQLNASCVPVINNSDVNRILLDRELNFSQRSKQLSEVMNPLIENMKIVENMTIVADGGLRYSFSKNGKTFEETNCGFISKENSYNLFIDDHCKKDNEGVSYVVFGKKFLNYDTGYDMGYLLIYVKEENIYNLYKDSVLSEGEAFLLSNGYIISHPNKMILGSFAYMPQNYFEEDGIIKNAGKNECIGVYRFKKQAFSNLTMVNIVQRDVLYNSINELKINTILIVLFDIFVSVIVALLISKRLTKSIRLLNKQMAEYHPGEKPKTSVCKNDEIIELEDAFYTMVKDNNELFSRVVEEKKRQKSAELAALQAQINPHFIYNSLDTICSMAKLKNQPEIVRLVSALSTFFRTSLHKGDNIIPVSEEMKNVQSYVEIERIRFPNKFEIHYDIEPELYNCRMLKLILQPLVENAIKHGFNRINYMGEININGYISGGDVIFEVSDNGSGMDFDPLQKRTDNKFSGGYGVFNVNERIKLEYGDEYGLTYKAKLNAGTTVIVKIRNEL